MCDSFFVVYISVSVLICTDTVQCSLHEYRQLLPLYGCAVHTEVGLHTREVAVCIWMCSTHRSGLAHRVSAYSACLVAVLLNH